MTAVVLFVLAAVVVGFSKTAIGGLGAVAVAVFASLLPARTSTAAVLLVYLVGDLFAIWHYRREFDWPLVRSLLPTVIPGLALGAGFLAVVDDAMLRRSIGALILLTVILQLWLSRRGSRAGLVHGRAGTAATGLAAGFTTMTANAAGGGVTTMTANAAGAVMAVYLVAKGVEKRRFVGTVAWFFFGVNVAKLPFSLGLGLLAWTDVQRAVVLAPAVGLGAWLGIRTMRRISQQHFDVVVLLASGLAGLALLVR